VAGKHCSKGDKMTTANVTSEYGKTERKNRECDRKVKRVIVSYLKNSLKYRVNVNQI
jgi:hypothetical protein